MTAIILSLGTVSPALAFTKDGPGSAEGSSSDSSSSSSSSSSSGSGSGSGGGTSGVVIGEEEEESESSETEGNIIVIGGCNCHCNVDLDPYTTYYPKVTLLHNVNAMCYSEDGSEVYYVPTLDDLPFDVGEAALDVKDVFGERHQFALSYDGYFDVEANSVVTNNGSSNAGESYAERHTTKRVYMSEYNDQALEKIGYDLLLKREEVKMSTSGGKLSFSYSAAKAGSDGLTAQTAVMDIYKALGAFEYSIKFCFGEEEDFDANKSPILKEIDFITSKDEVKGIDTSESACYVSATRTKPQLYWDKFIKDGVNTGIKDCDKDNMSTIYHVGTPVVQSKTVTAAQFCNLAVALMNIYGEPAVTDEEITNFEQSCGATLVGFNELSDVEKRSVEYLIIKGIIDSKTAQNIEWNKPVSLLSKGSGDYNNVISWLGRIANPDTRLKMKESGSIDPQLKAAGYTNADINFSSVTNYLEENKNHLTSTYDYLVEFDDNMLDPRNAQTVRYFSSGDEDFQEEPNASTIKNSTAVYKIEDIVEEETTDTEETGEAEEEAEDLEEWTSHNNIFFDTNNIYLKCNDKNLSRASTVDEVGTGSKKKNQYYYIGVEEYDGKKYYHFRISKNVKGEITPYLKIDNSVMGFCDKKEKDMTIGKKKKHVTYFRVQSSNPKTKELCSFKDGGGVYNLPKSVTENTVLKRLSFTSQNFTNTFVDKNTKQFNILRKEPLADDMFVLRFLTTADKLGEARTKDLELAGDVSIDWSNLWKDGNLQLGVPVYLTLPPGKTAQCLVEEANHKHGGKLVVEVLTNAPDLIKESYLITSKGSKKAEKVKSKNAKGYIRYKTDASDSADLMVSVSYLRDIGLISTFKEVSSGIYVITTTKYSSNIVINKNKRLIFVGDTVMVEKNTAGGDVANVTDPLVVTVKGENYISYKACFGWAGDYAFIRSGDDQSVSIVLPDDYNIGQEYVERKIEKIHSFPISNGDINTLWMTCYKQDTQGNKTIDCEGISLCGTYALAPYLLVHVVDNRVENVNDDEGNDYLFVWHRTGIKNTNGKAANIKKADSKKAKEVFQNLTGCDLSSVKDEDYRLAYYVLNKKASRTKTNNTITSPTTNTKTTLAGFHYVTTKRKDHRFKSMTASAGWIYNPKEAAQGSMTECLNAYVRSVHFSDNSLDGRIKYKNTALSSTTMNAMPIFVNNNRYYDANMNSCAETGTNDMQPLGTLPGALISNRNTDTLSKMNDTGQWSPVPNTKASDYEIKTAPVSIFAQLKGIGRMELKNITAGTIYFGSARCVLKNGKLTLADEVTSVPTNSTAVCTYLGTGNSTVYAVTDNDGVLSDLLDSAEVLLEYALEDPDNLVDWDKYKFNRLIQDTDRWSSVALIFILNILPRVCALMFFILMMLSLIKNVKPWQKFCHRFFDVYKLLSMGHQSVDTIDTKRMCFISLICCALFIMIIDGQLFNFIIFVAKFVIALYQK